MVKLRKDKSDKPNSHYFLSRIDAVPKRFSSENRDNFDVLAMKNGYRCCRCRIVFQVLTVDHIVPKRIKPNPHRSSIHNMRLLCETCHRYRNFLEMIPIFQFIRNYSYLGYFSNTTSPTLRFHSNEVIFW